MAVKMLIDRGRSHPTFIAYVDMENRWKVEIPGEPDLSEIEANVLANEALDEDGLQGYVPDPPNRYAHAIVHRYPASRIISGLYRVPMDGGPHVLY